jgi:ABC-type lipoprotein release transport system permease subunit
MSSLQDGTYGSMIDMSVKLSSGYLQIQNPEYQDNKSINNLFSPTEELLTLVSNIPEITTTAKRLESFALLSSGPNTRGGAVIGIEPEKDSKTSNLKNWIHKGEFITNNDQGILLTYNIAEHLKLGINDTIILISQGYHGVTAAGAYPVKGILKFNTPQMNSLGVFMDINLAQQFYSAEDMLTSLMIMVDDYTDVAPAVRKLDKSLNGNFNVLSWQELNPETVQFIDSDKSGGIVMKAILYIVIGFGIFGTIIMMVAERKRELGVMVAVGMQKFKLAIILFYETILIGIVGVISGFMASIPIIMLLVQNPIELPPDLAEAYVQFGFEPFMYFGTAPAVFTNQMLAVFIMTLVISLYPIFKVKNLKVTKALRA